MVERDQVPQIELLHIILQLQSVQQSMKERHADVPLLIRPKRKKEMARFRISFRSRSTSLKSQLVGKGDPSFERTLDHTRPPPLISIKFLVGVRVNTDSQVVTRGEGSA